MGNEIKAAYKKLLEARDGSDVSNVSFLEMRETLFEEGIEIETGFHEIVGWPDQSNIKIIVEPMISIPV